MKFSNLISAVFRKLSFTVVDDVNAYLIRDRIEGERIVNVTKEFPSVKVSYAETRLRRGCPAERREFSYEFEPIYFCKVKNAVVNVVNGACVVKGKYLFRQSISIQKSFFEYVTAKWPVRRRYNHSIESGVVIAHSNNAWHFFLDDFGYLLLLNREYQIGPVIINQIAAEFVKAVLNKFTPNIIEICADRDVLIMDYSFATRGRLSQFAHPEVVNCLRSHFNCDRSTGIEPNKNNLIYISRSKSRARTVDGEKKLEEYIRSIGGQVLWLEDLPFEEQQRKISDANIIVGLHGAGLTNILWAPENALVLEILPQHGANACYLSLANACSHRYYSVECDASDISKFGSVPLDVIKSFFNQHLEAYSILAR